MDDDLVKRLREIASTIERRPVIGHWPEMRADKDADVVRKAADRIERMAAGQNSGAPQLSMAALVDRFLSWPLPKSVRSDTCVTMEYPHHRSGTNLLTADEARQMLQHVIKELVCDCDNPRQCWEPCGELGHSEEHARVAPDSAPPSPQAAPESVRAMVMSADGLRVEANVAVPAESASHAELVRRVESIRAECSHEKHRITHDDLNWLCDQATTLSRSVPVSAELIEALRAYEPLDADGVFVKVSRQACDEAAAALSRSIPATASHAELVEALQWDANHTEHYLLCRKMADALSRSGPSKEAPRPSLGATEHTLMVVNMLLEDVAADPSRLVRAQEIAKRDLTPPSPQAAPSAELIAALRARCPGNGDAEAEFVCDCQSYEAGEQGAPCPPGCCVMAEEKDVRSILAAIELEDGTPPSHTAAPSEEAVKWAERMKHYRVEPDTRSAADFILRLAGEKP